MDYSVVEDSDEDEPKNEKVTTPEVKKQETKKQETKQVPLINGLPAKVFSNHYMADYHTQKYK
jgi:hypothetical protein